MVIKSIELIRPVQLRWQGGQVEEGRGDPASRRPCGSRNGAVAIIPRVFGPFRPSVLATITVRYQKNSKVRPIEGPVDPGVGNFRTSGL